MNSPPEPDSSPSSCARTASSAALPDSAPLVRAPTRRGYMRPNIVSSGGRRIAHPCWTLMAGPVETHINDTLDALVRVESQQTSVLDFGDGLDVKRSSPEWL